jgi:Glycosyltransferase family 10 (fucosyltransferase) C-term
MIEKKNIRVKFISRVKLPDMNIGRDFLRRFPNRIPILGKCHYIFDRECRDYDWLVVYDDLPRNTPIEKLACPRENTMLITTEPSSITHYGKTYLSQFSHLLTSQEPWAVKHPSLIYRQPGLLWYYGGNDQRGTYDSLISAPVIPKSKLFSSVCSTKAMKHTLHSQRLEFTKRLMADIPELQTYGYGMRDVVNKADAIDPYQYHLVIENHSSKHHWTEKLADAFLGYALPIYFGCTNLNLYFEADSFIQINIENYDAAKKIILEIIHSDEYEKRLPAIIESRNRVIHSYSTFAQISQLVQERHLPQSSAAADGKIYGRRKFRERHPLSIITETFGNLKKKSKR